MRRAIIVVWIWLSLAGVASPQAIPQPVPRLVPFSGQLTDAAGQPATLLVAIYEEQTGGAPLWVEIHVVELDTQGRYSVLLGSTTDGLPQDLFTTNAARWLGVQPQGQDEQPRVRFVAVPYAIKAADAETLGGKPLSQFLLVDSPEMPTAGSSGAKSATTTSQRAGGSDVVTATQTIDDTLVVTGRLGVGTASPTEVLDVSGNTLSADGILTLEPGGKLTGTAGNDLNIVAPATRSIYLKYGTSLALAVDNVGRVGIGTSAPAAMFEVSGTTLSADGILALEPGGKLTSASGNDLNLDVPSGRTLLIKNAGSTAMVLDNSGNLGIGTTSPTARLHVGGSVSATGNLTVTGNVDVTGNIAAKYQDVAEWVDAAELMAPGTVVVIDAAAPNRVRIAGQAYDTAVAGAVSPRPGLVLGEAGPGKALVAQSGRVRIKVDATYGAIKVGDLLVTSPTPGHAMRSAPVKLGGTRIHRPGTILGKALEPLAAGRGEILVLLTLQ